MEETKNGTNPNQNMSTAADGSKNTATAQQKPVSSLEREMGTTTSNQHPSPLPIGGMNNSALHDLPQSDLEKGIDTTAATQNPSGSLQEQPDVAASPQDPPSNLEKEQEADQFQTVTWNGNADPENPLNWPASRKWVNLMVISLQGMLSPLSSTILAIAAVEIATDFHLTSPYIPALPVGVYVLGLGIGPLVLAPCSELYGRRIVYILTFLVFTVMTVGSALSPNIATLCVLRLLSGMAGSAGPSLGAASMGDMFNPQERGRAQAVYSMGPTLGPTLGGVAGGFIVYGTGGWKWLMWVVAIASGVVNILSILFLRETYGPYILSRRAARLSKENPNSAFHAVVRPPPAKELFFRSITRPMRLLFTSPICAFMSVYVSLIYAILYLHLLVIPLLFGPVPQYGLHSYKWTHGTFGLANLAAFLGALLGAASCGLLANQSYAYELRKQQRRTGDSTRRPEMRLPFMQLGMMVIPAGLILFAWTAGKTHWVFPLLGACIFCIGIYAVYVCIHTYLVDCFGRWAASAIAAAVVTRCVVTCTFCVVGFQLYAKLGYAWGSMMLAFICIAMIPAPFFIKAYGPKLREKHLNF